MADRTLPRVVALVTCALVVILVNHQLQAAPARREFAAPSAGAFRAAVDMATSMVEQPAPAAVAWQADAADGLSCKAPTHGVEPRAEAQLVHFGDSAPSDLSATCDSQVGHAWLRELAASEATVCAAASGRGSRITRWRNRNNSTIYWMRDVVVDFSLARVEHSRRRFEPGFVRARCSPEPGFLGVGASADPGLRALEASPSASLPACDQTVSLPTLVVQHDDIRSVYHSLADLWRVWVTLAVLQQPRCVPSARAREPNVCRGPGADSTFAVAAKPACKPGEELLLGLDPEALQLVNMDATLMCNERNLAGQRLDEPIPDCEGPYFGAYRRWFGREVVPASAFGRKRVCFKALGWAARLRDSQVWSGFYERSACDVRSPLLRRFADYTLQRWGVLHVRPRACACTPCDACTAAAPVRILYVRRRRRRLPTGRDASGVIRNERALVEMLRQAGRGRTAVELDAPDFARLPMPDQLRRARGAHIVVGVHGAGMSYSLYMSETDTCGGRTSVVELMPAESTSVRATQHLAAYGGVRYWRWESTRPAGKRRALTVDVAAVAALVEQAVAYVLDTRGACA